MENAEKNELQGGKMGKEVKEQSFIGICLTKRNGLNFPKVFGSGFSKITVNYLDSKIASSMERGAPFEIIYSGKDVVGNGSLDDIRVVGAEVLKIE